MSNQNDSQNTNDRKADMSQVTGKQESATANRAQATQAVATHSLSEVARLEPPRLVHPQLAQLGWRQKIFTPGLVANMY